MKLVTSRLYKVGEKRFTRGKIVWDFLVGDHRVSGTLFSLLVTPSPSPSQKNPKNPKKFYCFVFINFLYKELKDIF